MAISRAEQRIFNLFDHDLDGVLNDPELNDFQVSYKDDADKMLAGSLTINGFLSEWALMTLLDPRKSLANLIYISSGHDPASTFSVTRKRSLDCKKHQTESMAFQCFVFGPKKSGKSALLDSFLGK